MARKKILLIDGQNILHQSFHKFEKLKSTDGKPSGAIFGFFKSLHMYIDRFSPDDVYITFDNGHSPLRDKLLPNYKGHRVNIAYDRDSLFAQRDIILKMLRCLHIKYVYDKKKKYGFEGDDYIAYLLYTITLYQKRLNQPEPLVTIVSSDKDFNQLLTSDRVKIFNPRKEGYVRRQNCKELFGYSPEETVDYLSLVGDSSDDIPGYPGIGPVKARKFLDEWGSVNNYLEAHPEDTKMAEVINRNKQLIDLNWFIHNHKTSMNQVLKEYYTDTLKLKTFKDICIEYSLSSFMTDVFIKPFKKLCDK